MNVTLGSSFSLLVQVIGTGNLTYQWSRNSTILEDNYKINGSATPKLCFVFTESTGSGDYTVEVSNEFGSIESNPATVSISKLLDQEKHTSP